MKSRQLESKQVARLSKSSRSQVISHTDFQYLKQHGMRIYPSSWMCLNVLRNNKDILRFGWTISRKVAGGVIRNRIKRWGREYFKEKNDLTLISFDINIILRKRTNDFYRNLKHDEFIRILERGVREVVHKFRTTSRKSPI